MPIEDSVNSLINCYLDLIFELIKAADNGRYANDNDLSLVNSSLMELFSFYMLRTSSGKHAEDLSYEYIVSFRYKLATSAKDSDDLFFGFDRDRDRRQRELTSNKL